MLATTVGIPFLFIKAKGLYFTVPEAVEFKQLAVEKAMRIFFFQLN